MVQITNYFQRTIALLASQFQVRIANGTLTNFQKMLYAIVTQVQLLGDQEFALQTQRSLNSAQGVQLDGIGQIVGLARIPGQSDAEYRQALQVQIFINISSGTPEQVMYILASLTQASKVFYSEAYPAAYLLTTNGLVFPENPSDLANTMQSVSPAGVHMLGVTAIYNTVPFVFSSDPFNEQFYVAPNAFDPTELHPLQVDKGAGDLDFFINRGQTTNPDFGGGFAEAIGVYPNYTYDNSGAGQLAELIAPNP